jgi:hypothetical protein
MVGQLGLFLPGLLEMLVLGAYVVIAAAVLGYLAHKVDGAIFLATLVVMVPFICIVAYVVFGVIGMAVGSSADPADQIARAERWATVGLVIGILAVAGMAALYGRGLAGSEPGKKRATFFLPGLWLGFCFSSWVGHRTGGWLGLLTITLPAQIMFWAMVYFFAHHVLPIGNHQSYFKVMRCLLTFAAGTNYPYYALEGREKVERVPGKQSAVFFSGPGIVLIGPDHALAAAGGMAFKGVRPPGVVFTAKGESVQEPMDLRPQQRPFSVEAITKDGIPVKFTTAGPFKLDAGGQKPVLGESFPFRASSIFKAFHARPIDIKRDELDGDVFEERERRRWDDLYEIVGTHVMQDIIGDYTFDQLSEPLKPEKDPRTEIAATYRRRMRQELAKHGIRIPGGGVSNLLPADEAQVIERRIENWKSKWQRRILEQQGETQAKVETLKGETRAQIQAKMIEGVSEAIAGVSTQDEEVIINTVAMCFVESLNQMVSQSSVKEHLPPGVAETVGDFGRHVIGGEAEDNDV